MPETLSITQDQLEKWLSTHRGPNFWDSLKAFVERSKRRRYEGVTSVIVGASGYAFNPPITVVQVLPDDLQAMTKEEARWRVTKAWFEALGHGTGPTFDKFMEALGLAEGRSDD
jgi:hypothetical protein